MGVWKSGDVKAADRMARLFNEIKKGQSRKLGSGIPCAKCFSDATPLLFLCRGHTYFSGWTVYQCNQFIYRCSFTPSTWHKYPN